MNSDRDHRKTPQMEQVMILRIITFVVIVVVGRIAQGDG
jgi:hypothetical protein